MARPEPHHLAVAVLEVARPEPFAVVAIWPGRRFGNGCLARVMSLHMTQAEAEQVAESGQIVTEICQ